jgi:Ca2+-binding RTX toxin-like protein
MKPARKFLRRSKIESLETRSLMAAGVTAAVTDGTLYIVGTHGHDTAEISAVDDHLVVTTGDASGATQRLFNKQQVQQIAFYGFDGDDRFTNSTNVRAYVYGGNGHDRLVSGAGDDYVDGGAGDDIVVGAEGNDVVYGGNGNDFILLGDGDDWVDAGNGDDQVYGEAGNDVLRGGIGNDRLYGDAGRDWLFGEFGNDVLASGSGNDVVVGGSGNDSLYGGTGADELFGEAGYDFLAGGADYDYMDGGLDYNQYEYSSSLNDPPAAGGLSEQQLIGIVDAAFARWQDAGLSSAWLKQNTKFRVADLPGYGLGFTVGRADGTSVVWIDSDAAGKGWFVDGTPLSDAEYAAVSDLIKVARPGAASKQADLLTLVMHEVGHAAGVTPTGGSYLMNEFMLPGLRLLPDVAMARSATGYTTGPSLHNGLYADLGLTRYFQPGTQNINWGFFNTIPRSWIGQNPVAQLGSLLARWKFSRILWGW